MRRLWIAVLAFVAVSALSACGSAGEPRTDAVQADAATLYKNYCLTCHGGNLQGLQGPSLQQIGARLSEEEIAAKITKGGGGMPAFKVSMKEEDVQALAQWLASLK